MKPLNEVIISGNLGHDPDIKPDGQSATLSLATNRRYTTASGEQRDDTQWHRVSVRGKLVQALGSLTKGSRLLVIGEARSWSYTEEATGQQVYMHEVAAHTVALVLMPPKDQPTPAAQ